MSETNGKRKAIEQQIVNKAQESSEFREALLHNPKAILEKELKLTIPAGIEVEVLEETPNKLYLVLPVDPSSVELPDEMLKNVAGGPPCDCGAPCW